LLEVMDFIGIRKSGVLFLKKRKIMLIKLILTQI